MRLFKPSNQRVVISLLLIVGSQLAYSSTPHPSEKCMRPVNKFYSYMNNELYEKAVEVMQNAKGKQCKSDGDMFLVNQSLGIAYFKQENNNAALDAYLEAISYDTINRTQYIKLHSIIAELYFITEKYHESIEYLEKYAVLAKSVEPGLAFLMAESYLALQKYDQSLKYIKLAFELASITQVKPSESWYKALIKIYYQKRDYVHAEKIFDNLKSFYPEKGHAAFISSLCANDSPNDFCN